LESDLRGAKSIVLRLQDDTFGHESIVREHEKYILESKAIRFGLENDLSACKWIVHQLQKDVLGPKSIFFGPEDVVLGAKAICSGLEDTKAPFR
jgi:hypothetical protein